MNDISYISWTDSAIVQHIGSFVKHHRLERNKTQSTLAKEAGISRSTLSLMEKGEVTTLGSLIQVLRVLDQLHVFSSFEVQKEISPITYAELMKKRRKRASGQENNTVAEDLGW